MPLFVISWMDKPNSLQVRMGAREAHLAYMHSLEGKVKLGGPFLDAEGRMAGSMIIVEAETLQAAQALHDADPYKLAGLFETSDIRPYRITLNGLAAGGGGTGDGGEDEEGGDSSDHVGAPERGCGKLLPEGRL